MKLTEKEKLLLKDLKTAEQICIEKYNEYAKKATDKKGHRRNHYFLLHILMMGNLVHNLSKLVILS